MEPISLPSPPSVDREALALRQVEAEIRKVLVGQDALMERLLVGLLARGHLLLEGVPGLAKTLAVKTLARTLALDFKRVQFTPDLLPADLVGTLVYDPRNGEFSPKKGPVFTNVLLADEINRTTPKTQSALLEAMNEYQVTVDSHSHPLPQPFLVIATQNPVEHHGTYPLPESQLDRFLMRVHMGYPETGSEREIVRGEAGAAQLEGVQPVLGSAEVLAVQEEVTRVRVDDSLVEYTLAIVGRTRESSYLSLGVSPRGSMMLYRAAQAMAFLDGRTFATPEDFKSLAVPVFAHRVVVNGRYSSTLKKIEQAEQILREIVESVDVPV